MITDGTKWHYLRGKMSVLLRGVTSKHVGDFYCVNCFHILQKKNLKSIIMYVKIMIIAMQKCLKKIIKYWNTTMEKS